MAREGNWVLSTGVEDKAEPPEMWVVIEAREKSSVKRKNSEARRVLMRTLAGKALSKAPTDAGFRRCEKN